MSHILLVIFFAVLMIPGIIGTILPILPGVPYMFVLALIFGLTNNFEILTAQELTTLGIITIISLVITYLAGLMGAALGGATKRALTIGIVGLFIGLIIFPPWGAIAGLYFGILIGQMMETQNQQTAMRAATGGVLGALTGVITNLLLGLIFLILFMVFASTR